MKSLVLLAALLAACASSTPPPPHAATAAPAPPMYPAKMSRAELDRLLAAKELTTVELAVVDRREVSFMAHKPVERPGEFVVSNAMPMGWSSVVYADKLRRLWVVTMHSRMHVPPNISISATRVFETRFAIPIGYRLVGTFAVDD